MHSIVGLTEPVMGAGQLALLAACLLCPVQQVAALPYHCQAPQLANFYHPPTKLAVMLQAEAEEGRRGCAVKSGKEAKVCVWYPPEHSALGISLCAHA